jgi:hypothetical protein
VHPITTSFPVAAEQVVGRSLRSMSAPSHILNDDSKSAEVRSSSVSFVLQGLKGMFSMTKVALCLDQKAALPLLVNTNSTAHSNTDERCRNVPSRYTVIPFARGVTDQLFRTTKSLEGLLVTDLSHPGDLIASHPLLTESWCTKIADDLFRHFVRGCWQVEAQVCCRCK